WSRRGRHGRQRWPAWWRIPWLLARLARLEVLEELLDDGARALVVDERLPDDLGCEIDRERADLGLERGECRLALGLDLRLSGRSDAVRLSLGVLLELGEDRGTVLASLLADLRGLGAAS